MSAHESDFTTGRITQKAPTRSLRPGAFRFLQLDRLDLGDEPFGVVAQVSVGLAQRGGPVSRMWRVQSDILVCSFDPTSVTGWKGGFFSQFESREYSPRMRKTRFISNPTPRFSIGWQA